MSYCQVQAPYPEAENGQKRIAFALDPAESRTEESLNYRLQLVPGRTGTFTRNEAVNIRAYDGSIEEHTVDGWGYDYYKVNLSENTIATKMMFTLDGDGDEEVSTFVPISRPKLVNYDSSAPVIVYLPEDAELRYSVWTVSGEGSAQPE